ncbi:uncharacterized protein G2W53_003989 [Senna tora]|uniref:Uncharacterized protein n=1 Tax=Senna tora TaxID=362788 RepID=A0A835CG84_9FABA|nr:uncharacterized protein G2W53_003989 [Senna tora]
MWSLQRVLVLVAKLAIASSLLLATASSPPNPPLESSYSIEEIVSLDSKSTADFFKAVQKSPPLVTSSEEEDFEPQSEIDLTSDTLSYTQGSSKTSFKSAYSWTVTSLIRG